MRILGTRKLLPEDDKNLLRVSNLYGSTHHIIARIGTMVDLNELVFNQSVCAGDFKTYHFLLVKK